MQEINLVNNVELSLFTVGGDFIYIVTTFFVFFPLPNKNDLDNTALEYIKSHFTKVMKYYIYQKISLMKENPKKKLYKLLDLQMFTKIYQLIMKIYQMLMKTNMRNLTLLM